MYVLAAWDLAGPSISQWAPLPSSSLFVGACSLLTWFPMKPDIKALQIQLTGFLDKDTPSFCKELWKLFLSAQASPQGVPQELLEAKKLELIQEKVSPSSIDLPYLLLAY